MRLEHFVINPNACEDTSDVKCLCRSTHTSSIAKAKACHSSPTLAHHCGQTGDRDGMLDGMLERESFRSFRML
jgi:hypothetical protein